VRFVAAFLALMPLHGAGLGVLARDGHDQLQCTDHLCPCCQHCPPKKDPAHSCHGDESPTGTAFEPMGCQHGQAAASPVVTQPHLVPPAFEVGPVFQAVTVIARLDTTELSGFLKIDLPPPRTRS